MQYVIERLLKEAYTEEKGAFLAKLLLASKEGHLCQRSEIDLDLSPLVVKDGNRYYLEKNWVIESAILKEVNRLFSMAPKPCGEVVLPDTLLPAQKKAIEHACHHTLTLICGGPGTGKTYTASWLVKSLSGVFNKKIQVLLAAPTGKAASHLATVLGQVDAVVESFTLHRLLGISPGKNRVGSIKKLDADLVIVDEASMLDVCLLKDLLASIGKNTRLVLMGDPDQLPPVDGGSLFSEMASCFGVRLERSMRVENEDLLQFAQKINLAEAVFTGKTLGWAFDAQLVGKLIEKIKPSLTWQMPDPDQCLKALAQFRVLGALRQGEFGIDEINKKIVQEMSCQIQPGQWWAIPIMVTKNVTSLGLYNGSCGVLIGKSITGISFQGSFAYFPEKIAYELLPAFEIAFCLSVHKSQGSEFEKVLALFPQGSENFGREALYTAVTRAKKEVELVGDEIVLKAMTSHRSQRQSGFTERLRGQ